MYISKMSNFLELTLICFGFVVSMMQGQVYTANGVDTNKWIAFALLVVVAFIPGYRQFFVLRLPSLERNPSSLGRTMSYICASKRLCEDLVPVAGMAEGAGEKYLQGLRGKYGFGRVATPGGCVIGIEGLNELLIRGI